MTPALRAALIRAGRIDGDGHSRAARTGRCPTCRAAIVRALDADRAALAITTDVPALTAAGELAALLDGTHTYEMHTAGLRIEIDYRDQWRIRARSADRADLHVVKAHECGHPSPLTKPLDLAPESAGDDNVVPY